MAGPVDPRLLKRARATKRFLVAGVGVGIATAILVIVQAWLLSRSVVSIFHTRSMAVAAPLLLPLLLVFAGRALLSWAQTVLAVHSSAEVKSQLRTDIMRARLSKPTTAGASTSTLINLTTKGLDVLDGYFSKYLPQLGLAATVPLIVGVAILSADWPSAAVLVITLPLIPLFMILIGWTTKKATARRFKVQDRLANHFADLVEGLPTLQAFGRARAQRHGVELIEDENRRETMRTLYVAFLSALALELLATLSVAVIAVSTGLRLVFGQMDFETALFVLILAPEAFLPVRQVGVHFHDSADGVAAANAAFKVIDAAEPDVAKPANSAADCASFDEIVLDRIGYTYPGEAQPALEDFSIRITAGEFVALAGTSGGGKSTTLALLMGFISPQHGQITVDGENLSVLDQAQWRKQLAWVGQQPGMISGTVADNVLMGYPEASPEDVAAALRDVGAYFPPDKFVGDDGEGLSAGEQRRVALARALLRIRFGGARLLVMDEPTAGLDAVTEETALTSVRELGVGAVVVSHRPAVLQMADRVIDFDRHAEAASSAENHQETPLLEKAETAGSADV